MIVVEGVSKSYRGSKVLDDVSFTCEPGTITGLLGPNGAGKSTTLRILVGLTAPDTGTATIAGRPYADIPNPSAIVGTVLDASAMHEGRSGRATIRLAALMAGIPSDRIDHHFTRVGLDASAAKKRVGAYSLGMRQRLALAQALLADPRVLILDEPVNGLDPEGIAWIRELLRSFADAGGTVLISSHLLREIEATADRFVVIKSGKLVASGATEDLLSGSGIVVRALDPDALVRLLDARGFPHVVSADGSVTVTDGVCAEQVARAAVDAGVLIIELRPSDRTGLEQLFLELTTPAAPAPHVLEATR